MAIVLVTFTSSYIGLPWRLLLFIEAQKELIHWLLWTRGNAHLSDGGSEQNNATSALLLPFVSITTNRFE